MVTSNECALIDGVIYCQCGQQWTHYGTMGERGAREVRCEAPPKEQRPSKELSNLLNAAQAFVGKSRCSLGHSVDRVRNNAKSGRCIYCKQQWDLYQDLWKAFQRLPESSAECPNSPSYGEPVPMAECIDNGKCKCGAAHEPRADHCEVCDKELPHPDEWSMPSCPDCQEVLEFLGELQADYADREREGKAELVSSAIELITRRASQPPAESRWDVNYQPALVFAVRELLGSLPKSRDWFNPDAERVFREYLSDARHRLDVTAVTKPGSDKNTEGEVRVAPHVGPGVGASASASGDTRPSELSHPPGSCLLGGDCDHVTAGETGVGNG